MPKSTLPSTEKKSAKPKVVPASTCKKKNDTPDKELHESVNTHVNKKMSVQPNEEKDIRLCEINSFLTSYIQMHLKTLGAAVGDGRIPASIIPYPVSNGYSRFSLFYDDNDEGEKQVRYEFEKQGEEDVVTIDCQRNVDHAFNLFIDDMKGQGISDVTYGAVINQFCHNMHVGVVAVGKAFNDNSDEYIIKTAPGSTDGVYVGQTWRLKSDDGPRVVIVRVGNGDVFYCFGQETETYMSLGFDVEMIDRKDLQTFTRLFCKEADHADVMRERKAKAIRLGLVWPLGVFVPSAATKK